MKLYATITSERATRGQGGNRFLSIDLKGGSRDDNFIIATILLDNHNFIYLKNPDGTTKAVYTFIGDPHKGAHRLEDITNIAKGEKQKSESCALCGKPHNRTDGGNVHAACAADIPF